MTPFPIPEILRTPLESLVLQAKIHSPSLKVLRESSDDCVFFFLPRSYFVQYVSDLFSDGLCHFVFVCVCVSGGCGFLIPSFGQSGAGSCQRRCPKPTRYW